VSYPSVVGEQVDTSADQTKSTHRNFMLTRNFMQT